MSIRLYLYTAGLVITVAGGAVLAYGRHRELIGRRDAVIAATRDTLRASQKRGDSLSKRLLVELPRTSAMITRWRTRYDSTMVEVPVPGPTRTDTVFREVLMLADSTIRQCEATLSLCQQARLESQRQAALWESRFNSAMNAGVAAGACSARTRALWGAGGLVLGFAGGYGSRR